MIPVYHPEVNHNGQTCIVPRDNWSPAIRIISELVVLQEMLRHPNPDDPLVPEIAKLYKTNLEKFNKKARKWTAKFAMKQ
mmetsp:Transcript_25335/g.35517  ORF Transcript_25335/g.35517 Transcript_25335/m.35517 type:complete len:80 (-) Transcript_25335:22-261(-)